MRSSVFFIVINFLFFQQQLFAAESPIQSDIHSFCLDVLRASTQNNGLKDVKIAMENGAVTNCCDKDGDTPLHLASYIGQKQIIEYLLLKGADVVDKNHSGSTPIDIVMQNKWQDLAITLLGRVHSQLFLDQFLVRASKFGLYNVVRYLLQQRDCNPNTIRLAGFMSPIFEAALSGHINVMELLVDAGADLDLTITVTKNFPPSSKSYTIISYLIEHIEDYKVSEEMLELIARNSVFGKKIIVLNERHFERIKKDKPDADGEQTQAIVCSICTEELELDPEPLNSDKVVALKNNIIKCGLKHLFHYSCLVKHLAQVNSKGLCPVCRS